MTKEWACLWEGRRQVRQRGTRTRRPLDTYVRRTGEAGVGDSSRLATAGCYCWRLWLLATAGRSLCPVSCRSSRMVSGSLDWDVMAALVLGGGGVHSQEGAGVAREWQVVGVYLRAGVGQGCSVSGEQRECRRRPCTGRESD